LIRKEAGHVPVGFALLLPLATYVLLAVITLALYGHARAAAETAATQAARLYGIYHDQPAGVINPYPSIIGQSGDNTAFYSPGQYVYDYLHNAGLAGAAYVQFNPDNAVLTDDGTNVAVQVTFQFPTPLPGLPLLLDRNASPIQAQVPITVEGVAPHEYQPSS
jgi:hypothetical protein